MRFCLVFLLLLQVNAASASMAVSCESFFRRIQSIGTSGAQLSFDEALSFAKKSRFTHDSSSALLDATESLLKENKIPYERFWIEDRRAEGIALLPDKSSESELAKIGLAFQKTGGGHFIYCPRCMRHVQGFFMANTRDIYLSHAQMGSLQGDTALLHELRHFAMTKRVAAGKAPLFGAEFFTYDGSAMLKGDYVYSEYLSADEMLTYSLEAYLNLSDLKGLYGAASLGPKGYEVLSTMKGRAVMGLQVSKQTRILCDKFLEAFANNRTQGFDAMFETLPDGTPLNIAEATVDGVSIRMPINRYDTGLYYNSKRPEFHKRMMKRMQDLRDAAANAENNFRALVRALDSDGYGDALKKTPSAVRKVKHDLADWDSGKRPSPH